MVYVMSDIHGNWERYRSIMRQIKLQPEDHLYVLGDIVDRYPQGLKILWQLMHMPNVTVLLGNHEYMMRKALDPSLPRNTYIWYNNGGRVTHNSWKHYRKSHREMMMSYLNSLPVNIEVAVDGKSFLLVHGAPAQWYESFPSYFDDEIEFAVWYRIKWFHEAPSEQPVIFGHTPTWKYHDTLPWKIWHGKNLIGIDCGSGYEDGRLACLRLNDMAEFYSE